MPRLSDTMTDGTVAQWHKKVGDKVEEGDLLAEIETDKATMEFESFQEGTLLHIGIEEGASAPVDSILAILGEEGEDIEGLLKGDGSKEEGQEDEAASSSDEVREDQEIEKLEGSSRAKSTGSPHVSAHESDGRIKISPLARKMAEERGFELSQITGTGDGGRITKRDVEQHTPQATQPSSDLAFGQESFEGRAVSQMRKTIARRLAESKFTAPHFYLTIDIDMERVVEERASLKEAGIKVSVNDFVIKAAAKALKSHPNVNSSWMGDTIRINYHVHMGVAVAVDDGLLVPVVRHADLKGLETISQEVRDFAAKAKDKKLQPSDWEGNTFTISNLGMFGIEEFTAIINPPDACIMAVGGIREEPVVKNGTLAVGKRMKVTLSCDHRVVDGATGAAFLQDFKANLELPSRMLL